MMKKCMVMGLDCAAPDLVFNQLKSKVPNITAMVEEGASGTLTSTDPPITIPAWMSMMTGKDAGQLGIYGFRHRRNNSYDKIWISSSESIRASKVWDIVGAAGGKSCIVGVPPTYPPPKIDGWLVSCFITPDTNRQYTSPPELAGEIEDLVGEYITDVRFRVEDRNALLKQVYDMTERRFQVIEYMLQEKPWDFFTFVEIGLDRIHHAFWKFFDKTHHLYTLGNEFEKVIGDYYSYLDGWVGRLRESIPRGTPTLIVSDHGAKPMKGAFCINQWLASKGYLVLEEPGEPISLNDAKIDWERTKAWGWGGYYARIFLNIAGREENGTIPPENYERERHQIAKEISEIRGPGGEQWQTTVIFPETHFEPLNGDPPDLMVYFDDLYWRSAGTVGHGNMYLPENDTGPDDAVHAKEGVYVASGFDSCGWKSRNILDIAPTCLKAMGLPIPSDMRGEAI